MTENAVECALVERETGHANFATRSFARSRRAEGADRPYGLHIRPRFLSFPIQPGAGWALEEFTLFVESGRAFRPATRRSIPYLLRLNSKHTLRPITLECLQNAAELRRALRRGVGALSEALRPGRGRPPKKGSARGEGSSTGPQGGDVRCRSTASALRGKQTQTERRGVFRLLTLV